MCIDKDIFTVLYWLSTEREYRMQEGLDWGLDVHGKSTPAFLMPEQVGT